LVLSQHAELNFQSANSLKQQSAGRYVDLLGHINGKATITSFLVLGMTPSTKVPVFREYEYTSLVIHINILKRPAVKQ
jgi:hypothetical protein